MKKVIIGFQFTGLFNGFVSMVKAMFSKSKPTIVSVLEMNDMGEDWDSVLHVHLSSGETLHLEIGEEWLEPSPLNDDFFEEHYPMSEVLIFNDSGEMVHSCVFPLETEGSCNRHVSIMEMWLALEEFGVQFENLWDYIDEDLNDRWGDYSLEDVDVCYG
jgi:peptide methionine sulfoxide reductase MsrA